MLLGNRPAPANLKLKISNTYGINYEWLDKGIGDMYADAKIIEPQQEVIKVTVSDSELGYHKRKDGKYNLYVHFIAPGEYKSFANWLADKNNTTCLPILT